eukprot:CAMPEP_0184744468 /NCGR_PEP_ID=MMETSP0315-20130426/7213_1 /TAXON_ID=101924 /ORGANISM="Rhodosorus marinus, Strain UTEX LB 2760" /LENGTH=245 /DNA_ID=CAMNT_0027216173 /DNA_START=112 /DNA_END=849 /DNA_ORIENTATION=+
MAFVLVPMGSREWSSKRPRVCARGGLFCALQFYRAGDGSVRKLTLWTEEDVDNGVDPSKVKAMPPKEGSSALFERAVVSFKAGSYSEAARGFQAAADCPKSDELISAEYELWAVQSYAAANDMEQAMHLLHKLAQHEDINIRKATHTLERRLVCTQGTTSNREYFEIPSFHKGTAFPRVRDKFIADTPTRHASQHWAPMPVESERYSLEWYKDRKPADAADEVEMNHLVVLAGTIFGLLFFISAL